MTETIVIKKVNPTLLDKQRLTLRKALAEHKEKSTLQLYNYEVEALRGVLNMLDSWSDKRETV